MPVEEDVGIVRRHVRIAARLGALLVSEPVSAARVPLIPPLPVTVIPAAHTAAGARATALTGRLRLEHDSDEDTIVTVA